MDITRKMLAAVVGAFALAWCGIAAEGTGETIFSIDADNPGKTLSNVNKVLTIWELQESTFANVKRRHDADVLEFVEYVEVMGATGGNDRRDCFKDPANHAVLDDYDFSRLVAGCRNIVRLGLKPYLKLGNVPRKFSSNIDSGDFGMNIRPPLDYDAYGRYMAACAKALLDAFGRDELLTWRFAVLTEFENGGWFKDASGSAEKTFQAYCRLYEVTVDAFTRTISPDLTFGAHAMAVTEGLWDERNFIKYAAERRIPLKFVTASFYDFTPGRFTSGFNLSNTIGHLRNAAESAGLTNLVYGIDEGRILSGLARGANSEALALRVVGDTYQAAYDARIVKQLFDSNADYFAAWGYLSGPHTGFDGLPSVSFHVAHESAKFKGMRRLPVAAEGKADGGVEADAVAALSTDGGTVRIMAYSFVNNLHAKGKTPFRMKVKLPTAWQGQDVRVVRSVIDDDANWFDEWRRIRRERGIGDDRFGWSPDDPAPMHVACGLKSEKDRQMFVKEIEPMLRDRAKLRPVEERIKARADGTLELAVSLPVNSVVFFELSKQREDFASPQGAARANTGPLFWMHGTESEQRLRDYVRVVAESGQGSLTIESRPHEGWMLDSWWRDVDIILDECRKRGIKMLIYDDYWLPSQGMGCRFPIPKEFQCRDIKFAFYERGKEPVRVENEIARVTANEVSKNVFDLRPDGNKVIVYSWAVADPGNVYALPRGRKIPLVNGLDEAAVDWFLEKFYQPYYDRYKDAFQDGTIPGFFFDEPYTKGWWGPALEREFAARGDNVGELITALFFRIADPERHARARYRFLDAHVEVWGRTMYGRHSDWCARRGVYSSGHFFEHGSTHYDLTFSGGNGMQLLKYVAVPGIDVVCRQVYSNMREKRNVEIDCGQMPKYASSMAHVYNRNGGLNWCETFGAYGQNLSYPQMKWICDWLQYQGCSFLIPHSFNMKAPLDSDCPPYFYNGGYEPRFPLFRVWADYNNRCALMLSGTGHVCRIAQCMPGISYHVGKTIRPEIFAFAIQDAQLDGDFMDYGAVETCRIGKNPRTGRPALQSENGVEWYDILVLPATEYVPFPVLEKALAFAKAGGVVVGYGIRPCNTPTQRKTAEDVRKIVAEIFAQKASFFFEKEPDGAQLRAALAKEYPGERRPLASREFDFEGLDPKDGRKLAVKLNEKDGDTILFVANQDDKRRRDLKVRAQWPAEKAELWNPMQGTVERPEVENGMVKVALEPSETVFVVWPGECLNAEAQSRGGAENGRARAPRAPLPRVDISKGQVVATTVKETVTPVVVEKGPEYAALMDFVKPLEGAKWIWHPKNPMARGHVKFRATLDLAKAEEAQVVFACDTTATIYVNGEKVAHQPPGAEGFYYGWSVPVRTNLTFKARRNEITVEAENRYPTESNKPRLAGFVAAFTWPGGVFRTDDKSWQVARAGESLATPKVVRNFGDRPWQKCMLGPTRSPYKESVSTEIKFTLPALKDGARVYLVCDGTEGEMSAAVTVNGAYAGGFIGAPYRIDITRAVKPGANTLEAKPFRLTHPKIVVME